MKKIYFIMTSLMLFIAMQANAQVTSMTDLYGKYKFTATIEYVDESYKSQLPQEADATISADATYSAKIIGFAGSQVQQNINAISTEEEKIKVLNPNTPQLWDKLLLANENGDNPYGVFANGSWTVETYGPVYYTYNPETKEISIPDFTVVTVTDYQAEKANIVAKYTNVKMTLVEAESIEIADIAGTWKYEAGTTSYSTMAGSVIPTAFTINLEKGNDSKTYNVTVEIEGYKTASLPATFDGDMLAIEYDNTYIDEEKGIRFAPMYGKEAKGNIEFKMQSETVFSMYSGFAFTSDSIGKTKDESADSTYIVYHQWYMDGTLKQPSESTFGGWAGVYNLKVANPSTDIIIADNGASGIEWQAESQMEVQYIESVGAYYVTTFMGYDVYTLNQGGFKLIPNEEGTGASIALDGYYGCAFLKSNGDGTFLQVTNSQGAATTLTLTLNEDGTIKMEDVFIQKLDYSTMKQTPVVFFQNITATQESEEEEPAEPAYDWSGDYVLNAGTVDVYYSGDDVEFPEQFDVNIAYFDGTQYGMDSYYYISTFMGKSIASTPITLNIAEDGKSAEMNVGVLCGAIIPGETYYKIYDMNAQTSPVKMTLNEDGTISIANFYIKVLNYNDKSETAGAFYKEVTLTTKEETGIDNIVTESYNVIYDITGRRITEITKSGIYIINGKKQLVK